MLDYQSTQQRLIPVLATAYALHFSKVCEGLESRRMGGGGTGSRVCPALVQNFALNFSFSKVCGGRRRWLQRLVTMLWRCSCTLCFRFLHRTMPCAAVYIYNCSCACCCVQNFLIDRYCDMKRSKDPNLVEEVSVRGWDKGRREGKARGEGECAAI